MDPKEVDFWLAPDGTLRCRKTYKASDWHYGEFPEDFSIPELSREIERLEEERGNN